MERKKVRQVDSYEHETLGDAMEQEFQALEAKERRAVETQFQALFEDAPERTE